MSDFLNDLALNSASFGFILTLGVAMLCGMMLGTERVIAHKSAGMRTYALVSMGAALFTAIGVSVLGKPGTLAAPIISGIITGIGFMGAGVIIFKDTSVTGLTTASGLWVAAGIGIACGFGLYTLAVIATLMSLFIFIVMYRLEQVVKYFAKKVDGDTE